MLSKPRDAVAAGAPGEGSQKDDFKNYYQSRPLKERRAIRKLLKENWRNLSGYDWKLIKQFRKEFKVLA
ncbi:unnamed protein product [marine sediment metagenome]|uniref:Uncharacterized protein n=1 Tax=marine sediment metagenome TaxID=412755 RepID=X1VBY1_9ZZZZ